LANNIDILINAHDNATAAIKRVGSAFTDIARQAAGFTLATAGMAGLSAIAEKAGAAFIGYNAKMEQTRVSMETMLGSAEAAQTFIAQMADFAEKTPFEFKDVSDAAKRFLAFGFAANEIIPTLTAVGNAAAGLGIGKEGIDRVTLALGQMSIKAKLSGEEVMQLNEAGIGAQKYLADAFNLTGDAFNDLSKTGITGAQAVKAIVDGMANDPKFKDMMEKQSKTAIGLWSTMKDQASTIFGALGQTAFEGMKGAMESITGGLSDLVKKIREGGVEKAFREMVPEEWQVRIEKIFNYVASYYESFIQILSQGSEGGSNALALLGTAIDILIPVFQALGEVALFIIDVMVGSFNNAMAVCRQFVDDITTGFTELYDSTIGIFTSLGSAMEWIWDNIGASIVQKVKDFVYGILDALGPIGQIVKGVGDAIESAWGKASAGPRITTGGSAFSSFIGGMKGQGGVTQAGLDALAGHAGSKMNLEPGDSGSGSGSGDKSERRLERSEEKMRDLVADLTTKIAEDTQDALTANLAKMAAEVEKWQGDINEAAGNGADVTAAQKALDDYKNVHEAKIRDDIKKTQDALIRDTRSINADLVQDYRQAADQKYQIAVEAAQAEAVEKRKAGMSEAAVNDWLTAKTAEAAQQRRDALASGLETEYTDELQHINNIAVLEGKNTAWIEQQTRIVLETKINALKAELAAAETTAERRKAIEKEIADATGQINTANRHSLSTAWKEASKDIQNTQMDYATRIKQSWDEISTSIHDNLSDILNGTQSLGDGMKAIFSDISQSITQMFLDMAIEQLVMAPLRNWFSGVLRRISGNIGGHNALGGRTFGGTPYVVGEHGPEIFTPDQNGQISPNGALAAGGSPINMYITTPDIGSFRRSRGQVLSELNLAMRGAGRLM